MRRAQRNNGNQQEHGTSAEVNGFIVLEHDPDERPTTVPSDSPLPNGHEPVTFGSASHESGTSHCVEVTTTQVQQSMGDPQRPSLPGLGRPTLMTIQIGKTLISWKLTLLVED